MLDTLKRWYDLLNRSGINSKKIVRKEIEQVIKMYEE